MPVLIVYGMPSTVEQDRLETLIAQLQRIVSAASTLSPSEVSVFFPSDIVQRGLGEELICFIYGFSERPEGATRNQIAEAIMSFFKGVAMTCLGLNQCYKIEVFCDSAIDSFASCNLSRVSQL